MACFGGHQVGRVAMLVKDGVKCQVWVVGAEIKSCQSNVR